MTFIDTLRFAVLENRLHKLTLSKIRDKNADLRNAYIRMIWLQEETQWQITYRYTTKDQTKNYQQSEIVDIVEGLLKTSFYNADLFFEDEKFTLLQSKKGKQTIRHSKEQNQISIEQNDRSKERLIPESAPFLQALGLSSSNGKIYAHAQDKYKQINKYIEIIESVLRFETLRIP